MAESNAWSAYAAIEAAETAIWNAAEAAARATYDRAMDAADAAWGAAEASAWAGYDVAMDTAEANWDTAAEDAWSAYESAMSAADAAWDLAEAAAWAAYETAVAAAETAWDNAEAAAWADYQTNINLAQTDWINSEAAAWGHLEATMAGAGSSITKFDGMPVTANPWTWPGMRMLPNWIAGNNSPSEADAPIKRDVDRGGLPRGPMRTGDIGTYYGASYSEAGASAASHVTNFTEAAARDAAFSVAGGMAGRTGRGPFGYPSSTTAIGTVAVVPRGATLAKPLKGLWPAVMKDGEVYVHHMHNKATKAANRGQLGPVDASGWVRLDEFGRVIESGWLPE